MTTITIENETLTISNGDPPALITVTTPPQLVVTQMPGVGTPGHSQLALSIPGPLTVATGVMPFIAARAMTIHGIAVAVGVAPTGANIIFDVLVDGATIFTTIANRPRILAGALEGTGVFVPDITTVAAGAVITVNVLQVGSGVAGSHGVLVVDST